MLQPYILAIFRELLRVICKCLKMAKMYGQGMYICILGRGLKYKLHNNSDVTGPLQMEKLYLRKR